MVSLYGFSEYSRERSIIFRKRKQQQKKRGNLSPVDAMQQFWMENPNKYFPLYIIRHQANAINQHKGRLNFLHLNGSYFEREDGGHVSHPPPVQLGGCALSVSSHLC